MAGTLLLHIGVDLFMEGVYDCKSLCNFCFLTNSSNVLIIVAFGKYDNMEYAGIWLITIVMTSSGMTAALIAGIIAALSTYVVQSVVHPNPIRSISTAATLRSSAWNRCAEASNILDDEFNGRSRILLIQLQGYVS
jgi:SulP family sulfate permease